MRRAIEIKDEYIPIQSINSMLKSIVRGNNYTQEISRDVDYTYTYIKRIITLLIDKGLLLHVQSKNKRIKRVGLTAKGLSFIEVYKKLEGVWNNE